MLAQRTAQLTGLETHREGITVWVRPEVVVEVAFDALQRSPRYESGFALRFARVKRLRFDKPAADATTLDEILASDAAPPARPARTVPPPGGIDDATHEFSE